MKAIWNGKIIAASNLRFPPHPRPLAGLGFVLYSMTVPGCGATEPGPAIATIESADSPARSDGPQATMARMRAIERTGAAITQLVVAGAPLEPLRALARATPDVVLEEAPGNIVCRLAGDVTWNITVDSQDTILGYAFSGYDDLMTRVGVNFSGNEYITGH